MKKEKQWLVVSQVLIVYQIECPKSNQGMSNVVVCEYIYMIGIVVTDTPTLGYDTTQMMGLRVTGYGLRTRSDKAINSGSWERRGDDLVFSFHSILSPSSSLSSCSCVVPSFLSSTLIAPSYVLHLSQRLVCPWQ